jgi:hypothetical protein
LLDAETDGLAQVEQRGGNDADIDAVEQSAETGDEDKEPAIGSRVQRDASEGQGTTPEVTRMKNGFRRYASSVLIWSC